ncbi:hypothetical protein F2P81_006216 [Scophthalmus maximus]|uniref:Protein FAM19A5-like n=1 Tax=Scophthalmus maximus TaxID=52904 RepID=A0A6A4T7K5_SCOMX|nr:hypothetical protein F2P81_006216 [Scophthalmus maximus]
MLSRSGRKVESVIHSAESQSKVNCCKDPREDTDPCGQDVTAPRFLLEQEEIAIIITTKCIRLYEKYAVRDALHHEGQLAAGTCEIVTLDRDSSQPRRTIARQTARCACRKGEIAGTTRARPACVNVRIVRSRQWCEMSPCLDDEGCDLLVNQSGWTCTQPGGRVKTTTDSGCSQTGWDMNNSEVRGSEVPPRLLSSSSSSSSSSSPPFMGGLWKTAARKSIFWEELDFREIRIVAYGEASG